MEIRAATYKEHLNSDFMLPTPNGVFTLKLKQVNVLVDSERHQNFSLFFHGPQQPFLPQAIYRLEHAALGEMEIFLVPVARVPDGFEYEAVFNLLP